MTEIETGSAGKQCPDCAETVRDDANVCRFCGYRFAEDLTGAEAAAGVDYLPPQRARKVAGGAAVLSLVVPGLGSLYIGETWRGAIYLATLAIAIVGSIATDTIGPSIIVGIIAAFDAHNGAGHVNATGKVRGPSAWHFGLMLVVSLLVGFGIASYEEPVRNVARLRRALLPLPHFGAAWR